MSLDRLVTRATLTPGPSSISYRVTVGPTRLPTSLVSTPWAASARTRSSPAASIWRWSWRIFLDACSREMGGRTHSPATRGEAAANGSG